MASQRPAVSTGIRQGNPLSQPFSRSHSTNAKASCCAGTAGTVPSPIPQPAKRPTGFIGAEALPRTGGRELLLVPPSVGGISPISNPPLYLTSFPFGHQLASVSAEQGDTRHQIPSARHGGTTGCHREPSCEFSTAYAGTFLSP